MLTSQIAVVNEKTQVANFLVVEMFKNGIKIDGYEAGLVFTQKSEKHAKKSDFRCPCSSWQWRRHNAMTCKISIILIPKSWI